MGTKTAHVFSTLACDQQYTNYEVSPEGANIPVFECLIKGGAGIANDRLITPLGIATEITEDQLAQLERNPDFARHVRNKFIVVRDRRGDPDKIATDMNARDRSKPLTPADYINNPNIEGVKSGNREVVKEAA